MAFAIAGILIKAFWVFCPKWVSSVLYIGMGWTCVLAFTQLLNSLSPAAFGWLLAGGIIYTVGGVIYAMKLPIFNQKHRYFGSHEIFHLFVMGGSLSHSHHDVRVRCLNSCPAAFLLRFWHLLFLKLSDQRQFFLPA